MRTSKFQKKVLLALLVTGMVALNLAAQTIVSPANYLVTTPGSVFKYFLNGVDSGKTAANSTDDSVDFSVNAGATYIFSINTANFHPVDICTNNNTGAKYIGASTSNIFSGTVTVTIPPSNYPPFLYYICNIHSFYGTITVLPPIAPPALTISKLAVSTNVILTFAGGTNTIALAPQYNSNLVSATWQTVPGYTNTFSGTGVSNTISFGRLDAICGPQVYLRVSQAPN